MAKQPKYKDSDLSFDFGFNVVKPKKAKGGKQSKSVRQQYALARKKGGPLYGTGGS